MGWWANAPFTARNHGHRGANSYRGCFTLGCKTIQSCTDEANRTTSSAKRPDPEVSKTDLFNNMAAPRNSVHKGYEQNQWGGSGRPVSGGSAPQESPRDRIECLLQIHKTQCGLACQASPQFHVQDEKRIAPPESEFRYFHLFSTPEWTGWDWSIICYDIFLTIFINWEYLCLFCLEKLGQCLACLFPTYLYHVICNTNHCTSSLSRVSCSKWKFKALKLRIGQQEDLRSLHTLVEKPWGPEQDIIISTTYRFRNSLT